MIRFCDFNDEIQNCDFTEHVVFRETIFEEAHTIFESREMKEDRRIYLPVADEHGQFICFCYDDKSDVGKYLFYKETIDCLCREEKINQLIKRCNESYEAIHIQDMNELSYGLYKLCIQQEIPVHVSGKGWEILKENKSVALDEFPENAWMHVLAEGTGEEKKQSKCVARHFAFLRKMGRGRGARRYLREEIWRCYSNGIHNIIVVSVPHILQISAMTEIQRVYAEYVSKCVPSHIREKIYGEETVKYFGDGKNNYVDDSQDEYLFSGITGVPAYKFRGKNGRRRLYIVGPCIIFGRGCLAKDSFCYQMQMRVEPYDYVVIKIAIDNMDLPSKIKICEHIPVQEQDILLFINTHHQFDVYYNRGCPTAYEGIPYLDTLELFESVAGKETWYSDMPVHTNSIGNQKLANYVYKNLLDRMIQEAVEYKTNHYIQFGNPFDKIVMQGVNEYIENLKRQYGIIIGSGNVCGGGYCNELQSLYKRASVFD